MVKHNRVGESGVNNQGEAMVIVEYNSYDDIKVKFNRTDEIVNSTYQQFKNGSIKSNFTPTVYGVGVVGAEKTKHKNGKKIKSYVCWSRMLARCYSSFKNKHTTYSDCAVCDEWLYYPNFKKWYNQNIYESLDTLDLDKDILIKNNKIYSPNTCVFVPHNINNLFTKCNLMRGKLPLGVRLLKNGKYEARCKYKGKLKYIGTFNTEEDAFTAYKQYKETYIKQIADEYKGKIPQKLYDAMYAYEVEITD